MNQKLENLLQLALQTPEETRARTGDLNVGFDEETRTWELIIKYHGNLEGLEEAGILFEPLIAGYGILTVPEPLVEAVAELEQIEYVEKPKRYFYQITNPVSDSCIVQVSGRDLSLTGKGVLLAVLDSGIDITLPEFRKTDGSTRIRYLLDQTMENREFSGEELDRLLQESGQTESSDAAKGSRRFPGMDSSGHGTAVAGIAGSSPVRKGDINYQGVATEAEFLIVKLGVPDARSFPRTTEILRGVTWAIRKSLELGMPLVINLSFGNSYGAHDGASLIERFLDNAAEIGRTVICVGSGNEGANGGHLAGSLERAGSVAGLPSGRQPASFYRPAQIELAVAEYEQTLNVQLWKNYSDSYRIFLRAPGGEEVQVPDRVNGGKYVLELEETEILVYQGEPTPYTVAQEIYFDMLPVGKNYITGGIWTFRIEPVEVVTGNYYFYLPAGAARNAGTGFYQSTPDVTLTIPSTASKVLTVGAYDSVYQAYADFSGRGYANPDRTIGVVTAGFAKPDIVAPGVDVLAPNLYGGYTPVTGTSFATPIVAGAAALLMEWGIVRGNDTFLYGEKVKAYLRRGAQPIRGERVYPNQRVGWGRLCVAESLKK